MLANSYTLTLFLENQEIGCRYFEDRIRACKVGQRWREKQLKAFPARRYDYQVSRSEPTLATLPQFKLEYYQDRKLIGRREYSSREEAINLGHAWMAASCTNRPGHLYSCRIGNPTGKVEVIRLKTP